MIITPEMLRLQAIIDENTEAALRGADDARIRAAEAEAELDELLLAAMAPKRDEQFEADMLDGAGTSDPYAPMRPSDYD